MTSDDVRAAATRAAHTSYGRMVAVLAAASGDIALAEDALADAALAQRLVRAKRRIKQLRIPFRVPDQRAMPARLPPVLDAIYGCYTLASMATDPDGIALAAEADDLAELLAGLVPRHAEAWGLAALIALSRARRRDPISEYVPLEEQDPSTWDLALIDRGEAALRRASALAIAPGRFQLEAALQSVYCARRRTGRTDWAALDRLYRALLLVAPTLGARVAHAGVVLRLDGPQPALALLDRLR